MGGVEFATDCTTEREALFVAGEDSGGVHGANRLGGNGVANSTVFGGLAGDRIGALLRGAGAWRDPDETMLDAALARAMAPFAPVSPTDNGISLEDVRERLHALMWDDAGIVRDAAGLARASDGLVELGAALDAYRLPDTARDRSFNLAWHDWINLSNLVAVSRVIVRAATARQNSRGAHYRSDFPDEGDLATSTYTRVRARSDGNLDVEQIRVQFTRVRPGESLV